VAGYITVLDLTRAGDLIRSRTMEAFFPLISVAVIYFFLTFLMTRIARKIDVSFKDKYYNHKIKGVDE
jgi:polar amino acid transport system substrate-binding protein